MLFVFFSNETHARTMRRTAGMSMDPPAVSYGGMMPRFNVDQQMWGLFSTFNKSVDKSVDKQDPIIYVSEEEMFLKPEDCPELSVLHEMFSDGIDCTITLSLCLLRRCRIDDQAVNLTSSGDSGGRHDAVWWLYCNRILPGAEFQMPLLSLNLQDLTLSPYTRRVLLQRRSMLRRVEAVALAAHGVWKERAVVPMEEEWVEGGRRKQFQWAQSIVMSRTWNSKRFGCAAIPILEYANHQKGANQIVKIADKSSSLSLSSLLWGFASSFVSSYDDEEYFVSYDKPENCDVDLWLDYGFVEVGSTPTEIAFRPCAVVDFMSGDGQDAMKKSVVLKRNSKIVVEQNDVVVFRQQFFRLLEEARESWRILVARGVLESNDNQVVLLRSELEMLEEIARDLSDVK